ncbi:uncharacterized protein LOC133347968 [Lethenteron reissneri]|uniref:uncharacterized protein LOC133347968 n=1 Tax=Lethenteron reissneri TaxID=7753 RepID=UPI002AB76B76|nr:uncharacterized protein LOC133347968 [Lethenteron reissneri]
MSLGEPPGGTSVRGGGGGLVAATAAAVTASPPRDFTGDLADDFAGDLLLAHNAARARHGAAPLRACAALEREARAWAEHLLERRALKHSDTSHGENLYYRPLGAREQGAEPGGKEVTEHWYSEVKHYDFSSPGYKPNTVHFTQLVWRASCTLGVGRACDGRRLVVVTLYSPAGNQGPQGAFHANVLPPLPRAASLAGAAPAAHVRRCVPVARAARAVCTAVIFGCGQRPQASDFQQDLLVAHNALRKRHGAKPLVLSAELCAGAQLRAEALLLLLMEPGAVTMPRGGQLREDRSREHPADLHAPLVDALGLGGLHTGRRQTEELQPGQTLDLGEAHADSLQVDQGPCDDEQSRTRREDEQGKPSQAASPNHQGLQPAHPQPQALQADKLQSSDIHPDRIWTERLQEQQLHRNKVQQEGLPPSELQPDKLSPDKRETVGRQPYQLQPEELQSNQLQPTGMQSKTFQGDKIRSNEACELQSSEPQPADAQPADAQPGGVQPGGVQPGGVQPGGVQPGGVQPGGVQPGGVQPGGVQPGGVQPGGVQPGGLQPGGLQPGGVQPGGLQPGGLQPGGVQPGGVQPGGVQPGGVQPGGVQPGGVQPGGVQPGGVQPGGVQPGGLQPGGLQPGGLQPGGLQPGGVQPGGVQPGGVQPADAQAGGVQPGGLQPGGLQPGGLQPGGVQPGGVQPGGVQPADAQPADAQAGGLQPGGVQPGGAQPGGVQAVEAQAEEAQAGERLPGAARWDSAALERVGRTESRPGENVYLGVGGDATHPTASEVTDAWYSEIGRHNFDILSPQPESARFCQLVWRASQRLGVGRAVSPQGCVVVVALYDPPALGQRCATPGNDADMIAVSPVAAPNGSCVPGTEAVDEDCGPRVAESADDDDCVLAVDAGVMLTVDDASGVGKSEKSSLVEGVPESEAMEDPERSVAESTATVMGESAGTRAVGTRGKTDASSEMAPKEAMPKSVSFLSLGDAPWTMELLSMQSADTDLDTEESSGTETLVMDSDRTTCEIMERSEAEAIEELPWVVERGHGGAGSCEGVGREDTLVMEKILDESRPKEHTGGGDEAEMVAGKDIRQAVEEVLNVAGGGGVEPSDSGVESEKTKRPRSDVENGTPGMMAAVTVAEVTCRRAARAAEVTHREVRVKAPGSALATKLGAAAGGVKFVPPRRDEAPKALARAGRRADCSAPGAPTVASGSKVTARTPRAEVVLSNVVGTEALIKATLVGDALSELYRRNVLPMVRSTPCTPQPHAQLHISEEDQEEFCMDVLAEHNRLREIHGARPLRRSVALGRDARAWARVLARSRALRSHPTVPHGQNVWARHIGTGELPKGRKVTNCWYADRLAYDYNNPGFQQGTGNFSQLVWRSSLDLGVGLACDGRGMFVAVAFYSPAGNLPYAMSYRDNVLPPYTQGMAKGQASEVTDAWYSEIGRHNFDILSPQPESARFCQLVWRASQRLGVGRAVSPQGCVVVVALYDPPRARATVRDSRDDGSVTVAEVTCRRAARAAEVTHREVRVKAPGSALATKLGAAAGGVKFVPPRRDEAPKSAGEGRERADCSAPGAPTVASGSKVTARTPRAEVVLSNVVGTEALIKATLVGDALSELYRRNVLPMVRSTPCTPQPHAQLHISEEDQEEFCMDVLAEHNRLREIHGARPLRRSVALGRDARAWARVLARSRALRSHPTVPHGQNVWARHIGTGELPKGRKVTNCWYADRLAYDYNNPGFQQGTGNFSQLVWRSSLDLGVGLACDGRGMFVAVAFYSPAGNLPYAMSYRDNVLPPYTQGMAKGQG